MPDASTDRGHGYAPEYQEEKFLADYLGVSFFDVFDLCITDFYELLRDAFIAKMDSTEEGRKALGVAWRTEKFKGKLDRETLRAICTGDIHKKHMGGD